MKWHYHFLSLFTISLTASALTPDLQDAFFAGEDFLRIEHFSENYHQHPSRLISKETDPEGYLKLSNEIQVELAKHKDVTDPDIQAFMDWLQSRVDQGAPLSYNHKVYAAFCGHADQNLFPERLPSIAKDFLDWPVKNACKLPQSIVLQNNSHLPFSFDYEQNANPVGESLIHEKHDPLLIPEESLDVIGLVPLIELMLKNAYPIALAPNRAHGLNFTTQGFGLHDYSHFATSFYFKNLYNFYQNASNHESLMQEAHSYLIHFTQYHVNRIKRGSPDESMQSRRIIVALFIALHENSNPLQANKEIHSSAEDLIYILGLHQPFKLHDYADLTFETSLLDGRILASKEDIDSRLKNEFEKPVEAIKIFTDGYAVRLTFTDGTEELLLSNRYYYGESEDWYALLHLAGIKAERLIIDSQLDHREAYERFKSSQALWIAKVDELLQELSVELLHHFSNPL